MNSDYSLSVITVVWNSERFIEDCINSVINQGASGVQHVIVDGESTDATWDIITRYVEKYPHIKAISEKDSGQSDAMNKGVALADAEVIGFLNADDYYESNVLPEAIEIFKELPKDSFLFSNTYVRDINGRVVSCHKPFEFDLLRLATLPIGDAHWPLNPSSYFFHKSLQLKVGAYDVDNHQSMDIDLILHAAYHGNLFYVDKTWGNFVVHADCKTQQSEDSSLIPTYVVRSQKNFANSIAPKDRVKLFCYVAIRAPIRLLYKIAFKLFWEIEPKINKALAIGKSPRAKTISPKTE